MTTTYRDGRPARILCADAPCPSPVISMTEAGTVHKHTETGKWAGEPDRDSSWDLVGFPAPDPLDSPAACKELAESWGMQFGIMTTTDRHEGYLGAHFKKGSTLDRMMDSVDAAVCVKNPAAYRELLEAAKVVTHMPYPTALERLKEALKQLQPDDITGTQAGDVTA